VGVVSFESIELWRPRRDPGRRLRVAIATLLVTALLVVSGTAAMMTRRPLVLVLGLAAALALAWLSRRLRGGAPEWDARRPRPWVPRRPGSRRAGPGADRRGASRAPATPREACNPQRAQRTVAIGVPPRL